jgi:hypothetical protein
MRRRNQNTGETTGSTEDNYERRSSQEYVGGGLVAKDGGEEDDDDKDKGARLNKLTLLDSVFLLGLKDSQVKLKVNLC